MNCKEIVIAALLLILAAGVLYDLDWSEPRRLGRFGAVRMTGYIAIMVCVVALLLSPVG